MPLFKSLFRKEEKVQTFADLGLIGVDMHSHFIPGIDDGASNMDESIRLITAMKDFGYDKVITTPHIYHDLYPNTAEQILGGLQSVRLELKNRGIEMEVDAAAEYYADENFENLIRDKKLLTFGKNYILFEISFAEEPPNLGRIIFDLRLQGYKPILAHPERYDYWHNDFRKYESLVDKDVLIQVNINCLTGNYGPGVKRVAERMIDAGLVSFIGSDCHHEGHLAMMQMARTSSHLKKLIESGKLLNGTL